MNTTTLPIEPQNFIYELIREITELKIRLEIKIKEQELNKQK